MHSSSGTVYCASSNFDHESFFMFCEIFPHVKRFDFRHEKHVSCTTAVATVQYSKLPNIKFEILCIQAARTRDDTKDSRHIKA